MTLGELANKQLESSDDMLYDLILNSGTMKQFIGLQNNQMDFMINDKSMLSITQNGVQTTANQHNTGSVARKRDAYFTAENLQKEFFIPSSIVTPIPSRIPWFGIVNAIGQLAMLVQTIRSLTDYSNLF